MGGGLLLSAWTPLPFVLAAAVVLATTAALVRGVREPERTPACLPHGPHGTLRTVRDLLGEHPELRAFVIANALWELSLTGLKTFIVLYLVEGLGQSVDTASAVIGVVAVAYVVAALGTGRLADRVGLYRLMRAALWVYGIGLVLGASFHSLAPMLAGLPVVALGGAVVMTLPYGLVMGMTPAGSEGAVSGLYGFSRGLGGVLGPITVGAAIDLGRPLFPGTHGYAAMWIAIGIPILASLRFLPTMEAGAASRAARPAPILADATPIGTDLVVGEAASSGQAAA